MAANDSLTINMSIQAYQQKIATLQGYVSTMLSLVGDYQTKKNEIVNIWNDDSASASYTQAVQKNIDNVQRAIEVTNQHIKALQSIIDAKMAAEVSFESPIQDAQTKADNVWS